jgi:hypothetical protein
MKYSPPSECFLMNYRNHHRIVKVMREDLSAILLMLFISFLISSCNMVVEKKQYKGTAHTTITYLDYDTDGKELLEKKEYEKVVHVLTGPPKNVGSIKESNPLNLTVTTEPTTGEEGEIWITPALVLVDKDLGEILFQYWTLQQTEDSITGVLTDTHIAEAASMNHLWTWEEISTNVKMVLPFYIATDSALRGTIDDNEVRIHIEGNSTDRTRPFVSEIVAVREQ